MSQWWRAVGNTVSDLTGSRFESQTSRSRDERVAARLTGCSRIQFITRNCVVPIRWYFAFLFVLSAASCLIMMLSSALVRDRFNAHMSNALKSLSLLIK